ncbi:hypothetical protein H5410_053319 [Solanum commersonii]|uniref:SWIM-type domain-containing protein n=1 Tax=Solanum commersonii TaxID=4109 RepID=A0A9J5X5Y6_SOLCO|nr:hypothetical protein H5410_053319 [Solanum commersonii]
MATITVLIRHSEKWSEENCYVEYSIDRILVLKEYASYSDLWRYVVLSIDHIYSVSDEGKTYIVCLKKKTCSCNRFQVDGISCTHAWRVLEKKSSK